MTIEQRVQEILEDTNAIRKGHFLLKSGMHTDCYINVRAALAHDEYASFLGKAIAQKFENDHIDAVVGFTLFGTILAHKVAEELKAKKVLMRKVGTSISIIKSEPISKRKSHPFFKNKSKSIRRNENVLIVDEGITTGNSIESILRFVEDRKKGRVKGAGVVINRSEKEPDFGVKTVHLLKKVKIKTEHLPKKEMKLWPEDECPLCDKGTPIEIINLPEENPFQVRYLIKEAKNRRRYHQIVCKILEERREETLLREIKSYESPAYELPCKKHRRIAVLGPYRNFSEIERAAREVATLGFYGISSGLIYQRNSAERKYWKHDEHETMNDFLRRMIYSCQYAIIGYSFPGGQLIETAWCSQSNKPTLGLVQIGYKALKNKDVCEYLLQHERRKIVLCNGFSAYKLSEKVVGGWVCENVQGGEENKKCPFLYTSVSKMILDFFTTSSTMHLVGYDPRENLTGVIKHFLDNKGIFNLEEIP